jgi:hypothetical protein
LLQSVAYVANLFARRIDARVKLARDGAGGSDPAISSTIGMTLCAIAKSRAPIAGSLFGYAGMGIAMLTLIDSIVRATIRQSESEAIASEVATASVSRVEATGATLPLKPAAPADRIMAWILQAAGESAPLL